MSKPLETETAGAGNPTAAGTTGRDNAPPYSTTETSNVSSTPPGSLIRLAHWVAWKKDDKVPISPLTGRLASSTDPASWGSYEAAVDRAKGDNLAGVGFVVTNSGYTGIDLDHCVNQETGEIFPWALSIIKRLNSYSEFSPNDGIHIFVKGTLPPKGRKKGDIEMYDSGRYLTYTGRHLPDTPDDLQKRQAELNALHAEVFGDPTPQPVATPSAPSNLGDQELIDKAKDAENGTKFVALFNGDWSDYPSQSEADQALCNILKFWTGGDRNQIDRIFRRTGLMRDKWDRPTGDSTYGQITIDKALDGKVTESYSPQGGNGAAPPQVFKLPKARRTDVGNGRRFAYHHRGKIRHCEKWGRWLIWDGQRWRPDENGLIMRLAKQTTHAMYKDAYKLADEEERKKAASWAITSEGLSRVKAMLEMAQSETGISVSPDDLDADPWLLNCENGTVDLRTGALNPHKQGDLITKLAPVAYTLEAECPLWHAFLNQIMAGNIGLIQFLQRVAGYSLTGDTSEQVTLFLHGIGANGKTTFLGKLRDVMGDYALATTVDTLLTKRAGNIPNDVARLQGARLVTASEPDEGRRLAEGLLKALTGGDPIAARFMRAEWFEFIPSFKLWMSGNHKPVIRGTDHAIWRRIRLVPFTITIPEAKQDKHLSQKLDAELPGILRWAIEGCLSWQRDGLGLPEEVGEATERYRAQMDKIGAFLADCCVIEETSEVRASELYVAYSKWCEENGEKKLPNTKFSESILERGFDRHRDKKGHIYVGLGLLV